MLSIVKPERASSIDEKREHGVPARPNQKRSTTSNARKVALGFISIITLWTILHKLGNLLETPVVDTPEQIAYYGAVAAKGYGLALGKDSIGETYRHHDHHKHKDHKHKDHKKPQIIPPHKAEQIFLTVPNNQSAHDALERYTADPHYAGSGFDKLSAIALKNEWEEVLGLPLSGANQFVYEAGSADSQGRIRGEKKLGVWIDTYYPILNKPVHASVTLLTPEPFHAKLREDIVEGDPFSERRDEVPVFHGLSISGNVKAQYVYAGYGRKSDFDLLAEKEIDVSGKIVIVKYGANFRGLKIKAAQEAGAIGVLIYSDPGDDGEITEANGYEAYPNGPARQPSSVQRGSVQFISKYPGDPSTPGEPAYKNATRVPGGNQPDIPSLPLSYEDAIPILQALQGKGQAAESLSADWVGGLGHHGVEYWSGPSDVDLLLVNEVDTRVTPIWNVVAVIPGHIEDGENIIVGNHRDAWVFGGADPSAGTAAQYELVRGLGKLLQSGWKPLRTIILASWDAEEYGLIGSTEWAEDFGDWLSNNTAAYVNLDSAVSGSKFHASASPSLAWLFRNSAEEVQTTSELQQSVWDTSIEEANLGDDVDEPSIEVSQSGLKPTDPDWTGVSPLGSGSDYTALLQRYGIASGDFGYSRGSKDPVYHYHSVFDNFAWQEKYSDPGFHKHVEIAKTLGLITLRLADNLVLPINTTQYAIELGYYLSSVEKIAEQQEISLNFTTLAASVHDATSASQTLDAQASKVLDRLRRILPKHPHKFSAKFAKRHIEHEDHEDHEEHKDGDEHEHESKGEDDRQVEPVDSNIVDKSPPVIAQNEIPHLKEIKKLLGEIRDINKKKQHFESGFITQEGIKDREWYKHKGVAPGLWLGYGATTFPALTEALTIDKSAELAQLEADELAELIKGIAHALAA